MLFSGKLLKFMKADNSIFTSQFNHFAGVLGCHPKFNKEWKELMTLTLPCHCMTGKK